MKNKLYLECYSGISGDMMVAALLDLGANAEVLKKSLESLPISGFKIEISRVKKAGVDACDFNVILDEKYNNYDHDMNYLHGNDHHHNHHHSHEHRGMAEITAIINEAGITNGAKEMAIRIFEVLAVAEAKAHATDISKVHFHEVGAVDSIVDIVAAAVCLDNLDIQDVIVPVLYEGTGTVRCQHGVLPVPVPAVTNIVHEHGLALHITKTKGEFVTPTGAAIVAAIKTENTLPEQFRIVKTGLGAGKRNYERPSLLRAMLIQGQTEQGKDFIYKLESNIDDCSGEALGYVMDKLFEAGAHDVNYTPVYMKKNRPGYQINVICPTDDIDKLEQIIFSETTTIGIRRQKIERSILKRSIRKVQTSLGEVKVKYCELPSGRRIYPEYSSVTEICNKYKMAFQDAYQAIIKECYGKLP